MFFFFFKQKTAYEMLRSLVGSEMCIRDSQVILSKPKLNTHALYPRCKHRGIIIKINRSFNCCLLYTSDAADDLLCVDLGGRRIIKKKKHTP